MRGAKAQRASELHVERDGALRPGERVLVACSGGPDSVALAAILASVAPKLGLALTLGHVNHSLRDSAWQDEAVVLRIAAALNVPVRVTALAPHRADEAALRAARYDALVAMARATQSSVVATAHTAEDQTETLLLALFRGTGPDGLAGMPVRRALAEGVDLARPLLRLDHAALARCCHMAALPYALDPTNADAAYRRNAVRAALQGLRPAFPGLDRAVSRAAELLAADLAGSRRSGLRRRVRAALRENEALRDVDFGHVEAAVRALESAGTGRFHMSSGVELRVERDRIEVEKRR